MLLFIIIGTAFFSTAHSFNPRAMRQIEEKSNQGGISSLSSPTMSDNPGKPDDVHVYQRGISHYVKRSVIEDQVRDLRNSMPSVAINTEIISSRERKLNNTPKLNEKPEVSRHYLHPAYRTSSMSSEFRSEQVPINFPESQGSSTTSSNKTDESQYLPIEPSYVLDLPKTCTEHCYFLSSSGDCIQDIPCLQGK